VGFVAIGFEPALAALDDPFGLVTPLAAGCVSTLSPPAHGPSWYTTVPFGALHLNI
jgi:hypothetical protein